MSGKRVSLEAGIIGENKLQARVRAEQVQLLYRQLPVSVGGTLTAVAVVIAVFWNVANHAALLAWGSCMVANQLWRLVLYVRFRAQHGHLQHVGRWARYWAIGSGISGVIWGASSFLVWIPDSPLHQTLLIVTVFAATAVAVPLIASHKPSFYVFVIPTLLPVIARNASEGDPLHLVLAFIALCTMLGILSVGRNYNRLLTEALHNRFRNEALAARLHEQNAALERARSVSEEANRSKTQFFAAASHDLRQPLHAMGLFAAALAEKTHDPAVADMVSSINTSVQALEGLFNELLDISKIDAGVIKPQLTRFALAPFLDRLRLDFEPLAREKGLSLRIRTKPCIVESDAVLLERILRNLVSNALRYTDRGGVLLGCRRRGDAMRIEVWDTGIGIPDDMRERIFDEFVQVGNPARTGGRGMGLGLSIVRRLCAMLDYRMEVRSSRGRGSRFSFLVPTAAAVGTETAAARAAPVAGGDLAGRLIVVIDDDVAIVEGMKALLTAWGADVITSEDGSDVLESVYRAERLPDLIVADYRLGKERDGMDVIRELRDALDPEIAAVLVTGSTTAETLAVAARNNVAMLLKPVLPQTLKELTLRAVNAGRGAAGGG